MNTESKTPRTDALEERWNRTLVPLTQEGIDLCRELERERDESKDWVRASMESAAIASSTILRLERERDEARQENTALRLAVQDGLLAVSDERDQLKRELDEARQVNFVATETCADCKKSWSPSLIESGTCIFCILKERKRELEQLKRELDEARAALLSCSS
jgi:hypothetical protein